MNASSAEGRWALVVPCYNEAQRLDLHAFSAFLEGHPRFELLFVDDGSIDETLALIQRFAEGQGKRVRVATLARNHGKAEAVRVGLGEAIASGCDLVGYWDADLATPLNDAAAFAAQMVRRPRIDAVLGSRIRMLGHPIVRNPLRHYLGRGFATGASLILRLGIYDSQCGAKLFRNTPHLRAAVAHPFTTQWVFDVELLARLVALYREEGVSDPETIIVEQPVSRWRDVAGSKVKGLAFLAAARDLAHIERTYGRRLGGRLGRIHNPLQ